MTDEPDREPGSGNLRPLSFGLLAGYAVVGTVGGWFLHPIAVRLWGSAPLVTWVHVGVPWFIAAVLGWTAWATNRALRPGAAGLPPYQAVNRLVLARACALVGALLAGGYLGYLISWVGDGAELGPDRMLHSGIASLGGVVSVIAALLVERACRIPSDDSEP